jgi:predicted metalloendopeptidase
MFASFSITSVNCATFIDAESAIETFNVQPGEKLYRKPEDRVKIW